MSLSPSTKDFPAADRDIRIEELTPEDANEISQLMKQVWLKAKHLPIKWRRKRVLTPEQIVTEMHQGYHYFGARIDGHIAGFYKALLKPEGLLGEHQTVSPGFRHRGLVRAMYRQFIAYASELNASANFCNIVYDHKNMRELVESFGFHPEGKPYEQTPGMLVQLYKRPRSDTIAL